MTTLSDRKSAKANGRGTKVHGNRRYQATWSCSLKAEMMFAGCCSTVKYLPQNSCSEWEHSSRYVWLELTAMLQGLFLFILLGNGETETRCTWNSGAEEPSPAGLLSCEQGFEWHLPGNGSDDEGDDDPDKKHGTVSKLWNVLCEGKTSGIPYHTWTQVHPL